MNAKTASKMFRGIVTKVIENTKIEINLRTVKHVK